MVKLLQAHPGGTGPLALGQRFLDKFEVRSLLGRGGHAWVYECFDRFLQRSVAVKIIKTLREAGHDLSRRARAEAQVLAGLTHPNLVHVLDAGTFGGLVYLVMEKLEGRTLRELLIAESRLPIPQALDITIQVAEGLQLAHQHGVIHRDLKPENIFIESGNRVKVLDFGVAKVLGASHVTTQRDRLQGTVLYMSPEQLQGIAVTPASDVFALGTLLFEMLYGHPLLLGGGPLPSNEHVAWMQLYQVPPPLESLDQGIPRYLGKLVGRAIVKLPSDRTQTMRELRDAAVDALRRHETERAFSDRTTPNRAPPAVVSKPTATRELAKSLLLGVLVAAALIALLIVSRSVRQQGPRAVPAREARILRLVSAAPETSGTTHPLAPSDADGADAADAGAAPPPALASPARTITPVVPEPPHAARSVLGAPRAQRQPRARAAEHGLVAAPTSNTEESPLARKGAPSPAPQMIF